MANTYTITLSDGTVLTTISEGTVDNKQTTSLVLHGRGRAEYGQQRDQNLVSLLENFANGSPPVNPLIGQLWFDKNDVLLKVRGGSPVDWIPVGATITGNVYEVGTISAGNVSSNNYPTSLNLPEPGVGSPATPLLTNVLVFINGVHQAEGENFTYNYTSQTVEFTGGGSPALIEVGDTIVVQALGVDRVVTGGGGGGFGSPITGVVTSFAGRQGNVVPVFGDYDASLIDNDSLVAGASVANALNTLRTTTINLTNDKAEESVQILGGNGLTGGGDLSTNRTLNVATASATRIIVNANDIDLAPTSVTPGTYTNANITVDAYGRLTAASSGVGGGSPSAVLQNLWLNITADSGGSATANTPTDTLSILGGTGISTSRSGDTITITNDAPYSAPALNDLTDVTLTSPSTGSILYKSAGDWIDDDALQVVPGTSLRCTENRFYVQDGTSVQPSIAFFSDVDLGIYRRSSNSMGFSLGSNEVYFTSAGGIVADDDITAFSDIRLKENLEQIPNALLKVNQLTGYTYNKKGSRRRSAGIVAQEVEHVLPEVVHTDDNTGMKNVAYGNMVGLLIEAIKDLTQRVTELELELEKRD